MEYQNDDKWYHMVGKFAGNTGISLWNGIVGAGEQVVNGNPIYNAFNEGAGYKKLGGDIKSAAVGGYNWTFKTSGSQKWKDIKDIASNPHTYEDIAAILLTRKLAGTKIKTPTATTTSVRVRLNSAAAVNKTFTNKGYSAPYKLGSTVSELETPSNLNLVRLSGANNVEGSWFTTADQIKGLNAAQLKDKFSLTYAPTNVTPVIVRKGATIRIGEAAGVAKNGTTGGGFQIETLKGDVIYGNTQPIK